LNGLRLFFMLSHKKKKDATQRLGADGRLSRLSRTVGGKSALVLFTFHWLVFWMLNLICFLNPRHYYATMSPGMFSFYFTWVQLVLNGNGPDSQNYESLPWGESGLDFFFSGDP
jgi:hypothetical protein